MSLGNGSHSATPTTRENLMESTQIVIDMSQPWPLVDEQFRQAYWRARPIRPRRPGTEATIPAAAQAVYHRWTVALYAHPGSPANAV